MIVVDASVVLELLLRTAMAPGVEARLLDSGESLHAPQLLDLEVAQVLRRYWRAGALDAERGRQALADLLDLPVTRYPHGIFLDRIWALRHNLTAYDAAYLALAEALGALFITRDARLAAIPGVAVRVEVL